MPTCGSYVLFEIVGTDRLAGTTTVQTGCTAVSPSRACVRRDLQSYLAVDVGWMKNRDSTSSSGVSLQLGGSDDGARVALRARHRWWFGRSLVVDAGAGPLAVQQRDNSASGSHSVYGVTAQLGAGYARVGVVTIGVDAAENSGETTSSVHAGLAVESRGMVLAALGILGGAVALASAIGHAGR